MSERRCAPAAEDRAALLPVAYEQLDYNRRRVRLFHETGPVEVVVEAGTAVVEEGLTCSGLGRRGTVRTFHILGPAPAAP